MTKLIPHLDGFIQAIEILEKFISFKIHQKSEMHRKNILNR